MESKNEPYLLCSLYRSINCNIQSKNNCMERKNEKNKKNEKNNLQPLCKGKKYATIIDRRISKNCRGVKKNAQFSE